MCIQQSGSTPLDYKRLVFNYYYIILFNKIYIIHILFNKAYYAADNFADRM